MGLPINTWLEQEQLEPIKESGKTLTSKRNLRDILKALELKLRVGLKPLNRGHKDQKGLLEAQALKKLSLALLLFNKEQMLSEIELKIG
jgi:hypothetical protein